MLSYRHGFHAGNYADVLKHLVLAKSLEHLLQKPSPVLYIDTHAGAGCYRLNDKMAQKTGEAAAGILKLDLAALPESAGTFVDRIQAYLQQGSYPGSPRLAADILRKNDRICLFELHSTEQQSLTKQFGKDRRVRVDATDGFASLKALLPVQNSRALVLMDPPYELKTDYQTVVKSLQEGYDRMPHANFLLWYPVVSRPVVEKMLSQLVEAGIKDCWCYELAIAPDSEEKGMTAAGMVAINPPWQLAEQLRELLPLIQQQLAPEHGSWKIEQLAGE